MERHNNYNDYIHFVPELKTAGDSFLFDFANLSQNVNRFSVNLKSKLM